MKKLPALLLALLAAGAHAQVTCNTFGTFTMCSDGRTYNNIGGTVFGSDGSSAQRIGNSTFINPAPPQVFAPPPPAFVIPEPFYTPPRQRCWIDLYGRRVCQ